MNAYQTPLGTLNGQLDWLPGDADAQVDGTISLMRKYAAADSTHPLVAETADRLRSTGKPLQDAVHGYVRNSINFVDDADMLAQIVGPGVDANTIELLNRPADVELTIRKFGKATGDCDDYSMYCAALLLSMQAAGEPVSDVRFVTISPRGMVPNGRDFSHVFCRAKFNGQDISMDCSHGQYAGWCYTDNTREQEWPIEVSFTTFLVALAIFAFPFIMRLARSL